MFQPQPDIKQEQIATLSLDYDYDGEKLLIHCRKALSFYMVRTLVEQGMLMSRKSKRV